MTQRWWPTAAEIAEAVRGELARADEDMALRLLLDGVNRLPDAAGAGALDETLAEPGTTGSERWDTLLAASIRYRLHSLGLTPPRWTLKRPLDTFWWPAAHSASKEYNDMAHSPAELVRVGIFMDERGYTSA